MYSLRNALRMDDPYLCQEEYVVIRIVMDSGSDYLPKDAQARGIEILPLIASVGGKEYRDSIDLGRDEFYELLEETGDFPTTSQITPHVFADTFQRILDEGDEVIAILLSSELSGTYQSGLIAQSMVGSDRVHVVDSRTATYAMSILADYACDLRDGGMSASEIVEHLEAIKGQVKILAELDTLDYLQRGGRLPKAAAKVGEAAKLKPVITVTEDGTVSIVTACLGRKKALDAIMKQLGKIEIDKRFPVYSIYSYGTKNCEKLEELMDAAGIVRTKRLQIGYVIGTHIGPGACGVVYVQKKTDNELAGRLSGLFRK